MARDILADPRYFEPYPRAKIKPWNPADGIPKCGVRSMTLDALKRELVPMAVFVCCWTGQSFRGSQTMLPRYDKLYREIARRLNGGQTDVQYALKYNETSPCEQWWYAAMKKALPGMRIDTNPLGD
jgi:hypothetical protein